MCRATMLRPVALFVLLIVAVVDGDLCRGDTFKFNQNMILKSEDDGSMVPQDSSLPSGTYMIVAKDDAGAKELLMVLENELAGFEKLGSFGSVVVGHFRSSQAIAAALILPHVMLACHRPEREIYAQLHAIAFTTASASGSYDMNPVINVIEAAVDEFPGDHEFLEKYGTALRFAHRPTEATRVLSELHASPTFKKSARSYESLARVLLLDGHVAKATRVAAEGLAAHPETSSLLLASAESHRAAGNCPEAIAALRKVIALSPEESLHPDQFVELAHSLMVCGELASAKELSEAILSHPTRSKSPDLTGWAHANLAHNAWLARGEAATEEAFGHSRKAMEIQQHWQQWPFYCAAWGAQANGGEGKGLSTHYNNAWQDEKKQLASKEGTWLLAKVINQLREHECSPTFILSQLKAFFSQGVQGGQAAQEGKAAGGAPAPQFRYSPSNYQYGTFFFTGFHALMESAAVQPHVAKAKKHGLRFVVLGSNVGNEAIYGALGYGLDTTGYEIICSLVDIGKKALKDNGVDPAQATIDLVCDDALRSDLSDTGIVYVDNEAWDEFLTLSIYNSLAEKLAPGALVIGWKNTVSAGQGYWKNLGVVPVPASWAGQGSQDVYLLQRSQLGKEDDVAVDADDGEDEL